MKGPVTIQVTGNTVRICGDVEAGETAVVTVTQDGSPAPVHQQTLTFAVTRRECFTFTLPNGTYDVSIVCGEYEHDYTITVPDVPNTPTVMTPNPNNPRGDVNPGPG